MIQYSGDASKCLLLVVNDTERKTIINRKFVICWKLMFCLLPNCKTIEHCNSYIYIYLEHFVDVMSMQWNGEGI